MSWNSLINSMFCFSPHAGNYPNTPSRMDPTNWLPKHDRSENMDILHMHRFNLEGNMLNTLTFFFHCLTNIESWSKLSVKHELETMHSGWFFSNNTLTKQTLRHLGHPELPPFSSSSPSTGFAAWCAYLVDIGIPEMLEKAWLLQVVKTASLKLRERMLTWWEKSEKEDREEN